MRKNSGKKGSSPRKKKTAINQDEQRSANGRTKTKKKEMDFDLGHSQGTIAQERYQEYCTVEKR